MFRRIIITLTMLLALPAFASAWQVTGAKSGGDATCRVNPAGSATVVGFAGTFKNVSTVAGPGFQVNRVTLDGVSQTLSANNYYAVPYAGKPYRTLVAYFGATTVQGASITVTPPANSTYRVTSPINGSLLNITIGSNRTIAIIPLLGYAVSSVTVGGAGAGACVVSDSDQFLGAKNVACSNIQAGITIGGVSSTATQHVMTYAGPNRSGAPNQLISLNGVVTYATGTPTYTWTKDSGPGTVTFGAMTGFDAQTPPNQITLPGNYTTFSANVAGTYVVRLTVTGLATDVDSVTTSTTTITVASAAQTAENICAACHTSRNPAVITAYDASHHKTNNVTCQTCHDPSIPGIIRQLPPPAKAVILLPCQDYPSCGDNLEMYWLPRCPRPGEGLPTSARRPPIRQSPCTPSKRSACRWPADRKFRSRWTPAARGCPTARSRPAAPPAAT